MRDMPADQRSRVDIERTIEESRQFSAEAHKLSAEALKLSAEQLKLVAEQRKLGAETRKLGREWQLLLWSLGITLVTGVGIGLVQLVAHLAGWWR